VFGQVEIFIAFATVMLGVSLLITVATQMVGSLLNLRGQKLLTGLGLLLAECMPDLAGAADGLAERLLLHPLISDSSFFRWFPHFRLASAIRKDELTGLLKSGDFAQELLAAPLAKQLATEKALLEVAVKAIQAADFREKWEAAAGAPVGERGLALTGALLPSGTAPELTARLAAALELRFAQLDKLDAWFESAMDRTSQRFAQSSRVVTVLASVLLCFAIQLDAFKLLTELSTDDRLRTDLVRASEKLEHEYEASAADTSPEVKAGIAQIETIHATLTQAEFKLVPDAPPTWADYADLKHVWGMLTAAALLSLGAPFWFQSLRTVSNLRPVVAQREEKERTSPKA
jgi:hypothetical protein